MNAKRWIAGMLAGAFALHAVAQVPECAVNVCLGYVSGSNNASVLQGMEALREVVGKRTAIKPVASVQLNLATDDLSLYQFIYWSVSAATPPLTPQARDKVRDYLNRGGFILIDIAGYPGEAGNRARVATLLGDVGLGYTVPMDENNILARTFYKGNMRGRYDYPILVEKPGPNRPDGYPGLAITNNAYADAWAGIGTGQGETNTAMKFGINAVMGAYTGPYKQDQLDVIKRIESAKGNQPR